MKDLPNSTAKQSASRHVYIQGDDFKAQCWTKSFTSPVKNFKSIYDMLYMLVNIKSGDVIIHRYQNCPRNFIAALSTVLVIALLLFKGVIFGISTIWICHNVDRETSPHHKQLGKVRRWLLTRFSRQVFVLDKAFISHAPRADSRVISFGKKEDGTISSHNLAKIRHLANRVDSIILIAGQDCGKYKAFERIPYISKQFHQHGLTVGFVVAGMSPERHFTAEIEGVLLRVVESNIHEKSLNGLVDFIYRENNDISMPYTIYAAATAGIPILTSRENILAKIVLRENIGKVLEDGFDNIHHSYDFVKFLTRHKWSSLHDALNDVGIQV